MKRILFVAFFLCAFLSSALLAQNSPNLEQNSVVAHRVGTWPYVDLFVGTLSLTGRYLSSVDSSSNNLIVRDLVTGENRQLTHDASYGPTGLSDSKSQFAYFSSMSPDGTQVAYDWWHPFEGRDSSSVDLRIVGVDGSAPRVLYHDDKVGVIIPKAWSPDGKHILAMFSLKRGPDQIVLVSVADGSVRVLKSPFLPPHIYSFKMNFSPDGRFIVYSVPKKDSHAHDIAILRADNGREIPLVQDPADDILLGWEPDGDRVLFASDRGSSFGIWVIQVIEGKPHGSPQFIIRPDMGDNFSPMGFTRDGSFYYSTMSATTDLYVATFDPTSKKLSSRATLVTQFRSYNAAPDWSHDGRYLAYLKWRQTLTIRTIETGEERELLLNMVADASDARPRWSPDGTAFLLDGVGADSYGGYRIDAKTGESTRVWAAPDGDEFGYSAWSPDGESIFHRQGGRIVVQELQSGREVELYRAAQATFVATDKDTLPFSVQSLALSSDGQQLAFVRGEKDGTAIILLPASGGEPRELLRAHNPETISCLDWTPDGRHLIFGMQQGTGEERRFRFLRIAAQGGEAEELGLAMNDVWLYGLSVHPDGQRVAFTTGSKTYDDAHEVWVLKDFLPAAKSTK
ncbi:MAG TPA: hypothetical protein VGT03_16055 [Candidatus Acidoferrales bacterium]|nr:hypothetical protein [Candidatus Acidoferrales bacterium]